MICTPPCNETSPKFRLNERPLPLRGTTNKRWTELCAAAETFAISLARHPQSSGQLGGFSVGGSVGGVRVGRVRCAYPVANSTQATITSLVNQHIVGQITIQAITLVHVSVDHMRPLDQYIYHVLRVELWVVVCKPVKGVYHNW